MSANILEEGVQKLGKWFPEITFCADSGAYSFFVRDTGIEIVVRIHVIEDLIRSKLSLGATVWEFQVLDPDGSELTIRTDMSESSSPDAWVSFLEENMEDYEDWKDPIGMLGVFMKLYWDAVLTSAIGRYGLITGTWVSGAWMSWALPDDQ